jgi:uncharacterized membrane protein
VIRLLLLGFIAMLICLLLQALTLVVGARYFAHQARIPLGPHPRRTIFLQFAVLMTVLMAGIVVQVAIWAVIYRMLGAFDGFQSAIYFSGVTYTSLGYGDLLLTGRIRPLAPLQAANGLMMFAISTAAFISAVQQAIAKWSADPPPD